MKKMKVEFMVEHKDYYNSDIPYTIVESYDGYGNPNDGYDIYQVETDDFRKIHIINGVTGVEYEADQVMKCKDGVCVVNVWNPIQ